MQRVISLKGINKKSSHNQFGFKAKNGTITVCIIQRKKGKFICSCVIM